MSLVDYSDLESEISNAEEPKVLKVGSEVKARIIKVNTGVSEKEGYEGCKWYNILYDIPDDPMVKEFSSFMWELDRTKLPSKAFERTKYDFQQFAKCFALDYSRPFSWTDDLPGLEGWLILGVSKSDQYGEQNTVKKYVAGR